MIQQNILKAFIKTILLTCLAIPASAAESAPRNYSQYVNVLFTDNMTSWDFVSNTKNFYTSFMPEWFFWIVILMIPYIGMYNRQGGIAIVAVIYLFTGGIIATVMPALLAPYAKWFILLGVCGLIYQLFVRD